MLALFKEYSDAQRVVSKRYNVIFYVEGRYYYQYLKHLVDAFAGRENISVCYITSDDKDSMLSKDLIGVEVFYIKHTLGFVFQNVKADVMVMTMPDLNNFNLKRSPGVKKYVYVFHALVSTHQQYRGHAFDHYDAILCAGPHHMEEIRESESIYNLKPKELIAYGYPFLEEQEQLNVYKIEERKVLIAPTWYKEGILTTCIEPLLTSLANKSFNVWIRPHPEFIKRFKREFNSLNRLIKKYSEFHLDTTPQVFHHLGNSSCIITDRSGIAFEYVYLTGKSVLFVDTPPKRLNKEFEKFSNIPVEDQFRSVLGLSLKSNETLKTPELIEKVQSINNNDAFSEMKQKILYPRSYKENGILYIEQQLSS